MLSNNKRGQMAVLIVVAIVIVAGAIIYLFLRGREGIFVNESELEPVFNAYSECVKSNAEKAISLAGSQGGRIYTDEFAPGSEYAPSSSVLNFLGFPVPYWYYIKGNGIIKEQVPAKADIEKDIERYLKENSDCNLKSFIEGGFLISINGFEPKVTIEDTKISIQLNSDVSVSKDEKSARKTSYSIDVESKLGKFYKISKAIYENEKKDAFFEKYAFDVLMLYAPVDGSELTCSPKIWKTQDITNELKKALEANMGAIKFKGNYYSSNDKNKYFVHDAGTSVDEQINVLYQSSWPTKVEINGDGVDEALMIAEPVGNQEGLGIMGFCYAPYHFVYDITYPVLVQIYNNDEIFQFPVIVVIDKNNPREAIYSELSEETSVDICKYKTQDIKVNVFDNSLNPIDANLSFNCLNDRCTLGESKGGVFEGKAPACVNGYLEAEREGYATKKKLVSTNEEYSADIVMDKEYNVKINLEVGGKKLENGNAIVSFAGDKVASAALPDVENVTLSEGEYNVKVYVYGNSSIVIPSSTKTDCREVPESGILGFFGGTQQQCFDMTLPEAKIDNALIGGGQSSRYILEEELKKGELNLKVDELPNPASIEQLQNNYGMFDSLKVDIGAK